MTPDKYATLVLLVEADIKPSSLLREARSGLEQLFPELPFRLKRQPATTVKPKSGG